MLRWLFISILMFTPFTAFAKDTSAEVVSRVMKNVVEDFIRPNYLAFSKQTTNLEKTVSALCENPSVNALEMTRAAFNDTAQSWARIELIRFGPVTSENRLERILFYPDRKSTGLKQVQRILAKKDNSSISIEKMPNKSVAVQGLGALEFILSDAGSDSLVDGNKFRCEFGLNVAMNLNNISTELVELWEENSKASRIWTVPGTDNPVIRSPSEAVNQLLATMVHGLESVRDIRIGSFLKNEAGKDRPRTAIFRRSENTIPVLTNNIEAIKDLLVKSDAKLLLDEEDQASVGTIIFELKNAAKIAQAIPEPVGESIKDSEVRDKLIYLTLSLKFAIELLDQDFAKAAGLSSGFSFSDGD